jgi:hypothetical protein
LSFTTALISTIVTQATTGKNPVELAEDGKDVIKNLIYPRTSLSDPSERVSVPTYLRDPISLYHSLTGYITSSLSGEIGRVAEAWNNRTFYGTQVYDPNDLPPQKALDIIESLLIPPISVSSYQQSQRRGEGLAKALFSGTGFSKAPFWITETPAMREMSDIIRQRTGGATVTQESDKLRQFKKDFVAKFGNKTLTNEDVQEAYKHQLIKKDGTLNPDFKQQLMLTSGERMFRQLTFDEAVRIFNKMGEKERGQYVDEMKKKIENERKRREQYYVPQE